MTSVVNVVNKKNYESENLSKAETKVDSILKNSAFKILGIARNELDTVDSDSLHIPEIYSDYKAIVRITEKAATIFELGGETKTANEYWKTAGKMRWKMLFTHTLMSEKSEQVFQEDLDNIKTGFGIAMKLSDMDLFGDIASVSRIILKGYDSSFEKAGIDTEKMQAKLRKKSLPEKRET